MASVHRKPNSPYWQMKYRAEDGRVVMRSTKQTNHKKALAMANEVEHMAKKARHGELTKAVILNNLDDMMERVTGERLEVVSIKQYFEDFITSKKKQRMAPGTISRYESILGEFLKKLPKARHTASIGTITASEVEVFRDYQISLGKSATTCDFIHKVISSVLNSARRKGLALTNPAEAVEPLRGVSEERQPFTAEQVSQLLQAASQEWKGMVLFGYHCGIRIGDAASLLWENIDLEQGTVRFTEQKTARRKRRKDQSTTIILHSDLLKWLEDVPSGVGKAPLFPGLHGRKSGSHAGLSNEFTRLMKKAGVDAELIRQKDSDDSETKSHGRRFRKFSFHSLRHSMISNLANADVSADVRKTMSGHASDIVHERYVHMDLSSQRRAVEKLPSVLRGSE